MSTSFETTGETVSEQAQEHKTTFAEVAASAAAFEDVAPAQKASEKPSAPKFVSAADLMKRTLQANEDARARYDAARKSIINSILGDEASFAKIRERMVRSAERRYTKLVLVKFKFVPKEGDEVPTHDERGTQVVYEVDGRKYYLYSVIKKSGERFFKELASRFGEGYWCDSYYNREEGTTNIFVSWAPRSQTQRTPRAPTGKQEAAGKQGPPAEKQAKSKSPRPQGKKAEA